MQDWQKQYYRDMIDRERGYMVTLDGRLVAVITYLIGDNDNKYLHGRDPWTLIDDEPDGTTLYIDQFLTKESTNKHIHKEFSRLLKNLKQSFPNITQAKWMRAPAHFRKKGVRHANSKPIIHSKNIK